MLGIKDKNYSLIVPLLLILTAPGVLWLVLYDIPTANFYASFLTFSAVIFMIMLLFIKESENKWGLRLPVAKNTKIGALLFTIGFIIPIILFGLTGLKTSEIMNPLFSFNAVGAGQSFNALVAANSPFWQTYNIGFVAGVFEELVMGFFWLIIGMLLFRIIRTEILNIQSKWGKHIDFLVGNLISMIFFTIIHIHNPTYSTPQFIIAAIFRFSMNFILWYLYAIAFTIGFHISNNLVFNGKETFMQGMLSIQGIITISLLIMIFYLAIRHFKHSAKQISKIKIGN